MLNEISKKIITVVGFTCLFNLAAANSTTDICGNGPKAQQLIELIKKHPKQQRKQLNCNNKLQEIALIKAGHIIESQDIWHHAGRMAPNQLLRHHGFKLPKTYPLFGNQVEALAGGEQAVELVLSDFLNSKPHKMLLLGEDKFFKEQDQIGVVYMEQPNTDHKYFWVVIIADESNQTLIQDPVIEVEPPVIAPKKRSRGRAIKDKMYRNKVKGVRGF